MRAGEEQSGAGNVQTIACQREGGQAHDTELEDFRPQRDGAFAVLIGEIPARNGEKQKRYGEEKRNNENKPEIATLLRQGRVKNKEADEPFEGVVAEGALKLDSDERPKATKAALLGLRLRVGLARWRRWHLWAEFIGSLSHGQGGSDRRGGVRHLRCGV